MTLSSMAAGDPGPKGEMRRIEVANGSTTGCETAVLYCDVVWDVVITTKIEKLFLVNFIDGSYITKHKKHKTVYGKCYPSDSRKV